MSDASIYRFEVCFPPDGDLYCGRFLNSEETVEEAAKKAAEFDGSTIEVFDIKLYDCAAELFETLLTLNHYMDDCGLENLISNMLTVAFNAGIQHAESKK